MNGLIELVGVPALALISCVTVGMFLNVLNVLVSRSIGRVVMRIK